MLHSMRDIRRAGALTKESEKMNTGLKDGFWI